MIDSREQHPAPLLPLYPAIACPDTGAGTLYCAGLNPRADAFAEAQRAFLMELGDRLEDLDNVNGELLLCGPSLGEILQHPACTDRRCFWSGTKSAEGEHISTPADILTLDSRKKFAAVLIEGNMHFLDQLAILQAARALLNDGGMLLLAGEYLRDDSTIAKSPLPNLSSCQQLAERLGLDFIRSRDYSSHALASLQVLEVLVNSARSDVRQEQIREALTKLEAIQDEFRSGRRCLRVMEFRKKTRALGEYADAEYGAIDSFSSREIAELFQQSFDVRFDAALWSWKYEIGGGKCVVAREKRDGPIVAHYGGAPRHIQYFGLPSMAIQVCDVMVLPEKRVHYGKSSLFFKTAATFLEREIGNTVNHLLGFGFPNQKAMNIALRLGLYEKTDDFVELVFAPTTEAGSTLAWTEVDWDSMEHRQLIDSLWREMAADFKSGIIGVRHHHYLAYRYAAHPRRQQYHCGLLARPGESPVALVVLKPHEQHCLVMDLLSPLRSLEDSIEGLRALQRAPGLGGELKFWLTRAWVDRLPQQGRSLNELHIEIPCNSWNRGPRAETLRGAWWLTAGDMDFL